MLVVTTDTIHGWDLQRVCGEVFGVHVRAAAGGESPDQARVAAVARMLEQAREKGGNVVVGLRWDAVSLPDWRVEVCAYGTAVVAAPVDEGAQQTATELGYGRPAEPDAEPEAPPAAEEPAAEQQPYPQQGYPQQQGYAQQYPQQYPQQDPSQGYPQQYPQQQPYPQQYPQGYPQQQPYPQQPQQYPQGYPGPQ